MRKFISLIILMLSLTAGCCSAVTCEVLLAQINTVGFGTVNVQRDIPVGATIRLPGLCASCHYFG